MHPIRMECTLLLHFFIPLYFKLFNTSIFWSVKQVPNKRQTVATPGHTPQNEHFKRSVLRIYGCPWLLTDPWFFIFQSGAICLHAAAMKGHTSVIKALLLKGAPVDAVTKVWWQKRSNNHKLCCTRIQRKSQKSKFWICWLTLWWQRWGTDFVTAQKLPALGQTTPSV